jgi:hypothetical protein
VSLALESSFNLNAKTRRGEEAKRENQKFSICTIHGCIIGCNLEANALYPCLACESHQMGDREVILDA